MDLGLDGKRCLVTGSTAGIGLEVVRQLAGEGARVVSSGRRGAPDVGEDAHVVADLGRAGEPERVVDEATRQLGGLDVLVNNVGIARIARFVDVGDDEWDAYWQLNVMSYVRAIRAALPHLRERGGSIVNVSSTLGVVGADDYIAYQASKGAVRQMTRSAALSYVKDGIRVNTICPGFIETPMTDELEDEIRDHDIGMTPMARAGKPIEVSYAVLYLASDESSFVTGSDLVVDGGYLAQ